MCPELQTKTRFPESVTVITCLARRCFQINVKVDILRIQSVFVIGGERCHTRGPRAGFVCCTPRRLLPLPFFCHQPLPAPSSRGASRFSSIRPTTTTTAP